jgi:hypothetical protein
MKAVWFVRARELAGKFRFWTAIAGYDPRDRSLNQRIYLIYVVVFFSIWGFSMLALLADQAAILLSSVHNLTPAIISIYGLLILIILEFTIAGYRAGKRSPFIFSEADAELVCQTPVNRGQVALAWYLGEWIGTGMIFVGLGVVFRYASLELANQKQVAWMDLPRYILAGFQVTSIILPLFVMVMAICYAIGALRLHGDKDIRWLRWIPLVISMVLVLVGFVDPSILSALLWVFLYPLKAGFSEVFWITGFSLAIIFTVLGLLTLYITGLKLNLSRAAQESRFRLTEQQVRWLGDTSVRREMKRREKLGIGHRPSRIPGRNGAWALIWKDWVASVRGRELIEVFGWLGIFGLTLGMIWAPNWGTLAWTFILGCSLIGQRCTERFRSDLKVWTITRQLAIRADSAIAADIISPVILTTLLDWMAMLVSRWLGYSVQASFFFLAPLVVLCVALATSYVILRHSQGSDLLAGYVAEPGAGGLILSLVLGAIPLIFVSWLTSHWKSPGAELFITLIGLVIGSGLAFSAWKLVAARYKTLK